MSLVAVRAALENQLNAMTPVIFTAWENQPFTPVQGVPYQRVHLLPAEPDNPELSRSFYIERGLLQIMLCYPLQAGPGPAAARAQLIRAQFPRALSLVKSGVTTTIERTPEIGPSDLDDAVYLLPVRVRWYANINS